MSSLRVFIGRRTDGKTQTSTALETFFYAMTIFPNAQKKAQQELHTVVGSSRLPDYNDWDSLPYLEALLREVLRWRPVFPLGVAHAITDDDVFKGYLIPKGQSLPLQPQRHNAVLCTRTNRLWASRFRYNDQYLVVSICHG
jgi:cytochrome P450